MWRQIGARAREWPKTQFEIFGTVDEVCKWQWESARQMMTMIYFRVTVRKPSQFTFRSINQGELGGDSAHARSICGVDTSLLWPQLALLLVEDSNCRTIPAFASPKVLESPITPEKKVAFDKIWIKSPRGFGKCPDLESHQVSNTANVNIHCCC